MTLSYSLGGGLLVALIYIIVTLRKYGNLKAKYSQISDELRVCAQSRISLRKQLDLHKTSLRRDALENKALRKAIAEHSPSLATKLLRDVFVRKDEDGNGSD